MKLIRYIIWVLLAVVTLASTRNVPFASGANAQSEPATTEVAENDIGAESESDDSSVSGPNASTPDANTDSVPSDSVAAIIRIEGMIYGFTLESMQRRVDRALANGATIIVMELNTPGGRVDTALKISKYLKSMEVRTIAWVNNEAYSAGIMIGSACDEIVMAKSSATGDCAPIRMGGEMAPTERAKALSPILEEFNDSATENGYDYAMFHAMCVLGVEVYQIEHTETGQRRLVNQADYEVMVNGLTREEATKSIKPEQALAPTLTVDEEGLKLQPSIPVGEVMVEVATADDRGKWKLLEHIHNGSTLLTLNQTRALRIGLSQKTISTDGELRQWLEAKDIWRQEHTWSEDLVAWLVHPAVRGVLVLAAMLGAYMELQSPGVGLPGAVAVIAVLTLLGAPFLVGLADIWHVLAFFAGFTLLMVELFVTPGFGVVGLMGIILMFGGVVFSVVPMPGFGPIDPVFRDDVIHSMRNSLISTMVAVICGVVGIVFLIRYFGNISLFNRLVLQTQQNARTGAMDINATEISGSEVIGRGKISVGSTGPVVSELRPTGRAEFEGQVIDVVSISQWVAVGQIVRVVEVHGNRIVVDHV